MRHLPYLPPELIALIVDHLHGDTAALKACSLVSHTFLPLAQAHIFENIELRFRSKGNIQSMRAIFPPDPCGVLSHVRKLSISYSSLSITPLILDKILDHFLAFRKIREFQADLDTFHFADRNRASTSRYFSHFQFTLRSLDLMTIDGDPKDVITFITFFPLLEELSLTFYKALPGVTQDLRVGVLDPNLLIPLRGTLRIRATPPDGRFITELAKVRVLYHTLEFGGSALLPGTRVSELIVACAPTLRIIQISHEC